MLWTVYLEGSGPSQFWSGIQRLSQLSGGVIVWWHCIQRRRRQAGCVDHQSIVSIKREAIGAGVWYFDRCFLKLASAHSLVLSHRLLIHWSTCRLVSLKVPHAKQQLSMELLAQLRRYRVGAHSLMNLEICSLWPSWSALIDCP